MAVTRNHDILGLARRINRFIHEIVKSQSAEVPGVQGADSIRLKAYQNALTAYKTWVIAQPQLDLPKTHPFEYPLSDPPDISGLASDSLTDVTNLLGKLRDELIESQSSAIASGLEEPDALRFDKIMDKINAFLTDYIEQTSPLDVPESAPSRIDR